MSGRISVDDRDLDAAAQKLRSAKGGLSGLKGQLSDGLAGGAPPAVAGQVRAAVAAARGAVSGIDGRVEWRAAELRRRAALTRIANGDSSGSDFKIVLGWGAKKVQLKDVAGGVDEAIGRWAKHWEHHYLRRKRGWGPSGRNRQKQLAWLTRKTTWAKRTNPIQKHARTVKNLRIASKVLRYGSIALDARDIVTAKGPVKQNEKIGSVAGGMAGAYAGAQAGAAIGALGGPIGVAAGGAIGATVGAVIGSGVGKWAGNQIGKTGVGRAIGSGVDAAKSAVSNTAKTISGGVKKLFKKPW